VNIRVNIARFHESFVIDRQFIPVSLFPNHILILSVPKDFSSLQIDIVLIVPSISQYRNSLFEKTLQSVKRFSAFFCFCNNPMIEKDSLLFRRQHFPSAFSSLFFFFLLCFIITFRK